MLRPLALAALVLVSPVFVASAKAQLSNSTGSNDANMAGSTTRMFIINATTPGALTFSGAGTASFNNAVGTSNQFNVGSNTSIGVNASVSATPEFDGKVLGLMQLVNGSSLNQSNGTSSSASATQSAASAANSVATETAQQKSHKTGWEAATTTTSLATTKAGAFGSYDKAGDWAWNDSQYKVGATNSSTGKTVTDTEITEYNSFKNAYNTSYNNTYNDNYKSAYNAVISSATSTSASASGTGIIKGSFKSTEDSISSVGQAATLNTVATSALTAGIAAGAPGSAAFDAAFKAAYNSGYQNSVGTVKTTSSSDVAIEGLGAIANVKSNEASTFKVQLDRLTTVAQKEATATANGSSASTLSTNSFATQNNQRTASGFMQAFATAPSAQQTTVVDLTTGKLYNRTELGSYTPGTATVPATGIVTPR